jgi:hypothetical protein
MFDYPFFMIGGFLQIRLSSILFTGLFMLVFWRSIFLLHAIEIRTAVWYFDGFRAAS